MDVRPRPVALGGDLPVHLQLPGDAVAELADPLLEEREHLDLADRMADAFLPLTTVGLAGEADLAVRTPVHVRAHAELGEVVGLRVGPLGADALRPHRPAAAARGAG